MQLGKSILTKSAALMTLLGGSSALLFSSGGPVVSFELPPSTGEIGRCFVTIDENQLSLSVVGAHPDSMYTIWVDFRNRATLTYPEDYPPNAESRGVAPAMASTQGVTSGIGRDRNSFVTDGQGNATFTVTLDYELLDRGDSPVVFGQLSMQGPNRVGGQWMRVYENDDPANASLQQTDPTTGLPLVRRATAQGLTIVRHPDMVTHGMTPGVGGVDHSPGFAGDFP